ncbi:MGDG synthase family glycosyltransferase [Bacillus suaedaesalsae]|uniref:UDP-glucuronosyltransferase n=1 Tax=Bacillus suaedaesalsae TaxID=2810349 RepID=A0ABS2DLG3_9BACI|nr:UDP-glucuronosyltransferase [Bacillus suaedaesalsae]MBM6619324.1 UDP-glucuronosyltransferase [Bacillus suaedaesalsae]
MLKVLFLPFLQIPSGHHQVVTTMTHQLNEEYNFVKWEKVDILSYTYKKMEPLISTIYIKWIDYFPNMYHWLYKKSVYESLDETKEFKLYEVLFLRSMKKLIQEQNPTHIVCSHALPSYLICKLKKQGICNAKLINVYTDYFIHHIWGTTAVDAHFISLPSMKQYLLTKGVNPESIYSTGIPVHEEFHFDSRVMKDKTKFQVLLTGGSLGVGKLDRILGNVQRDGHIQYHVLCGSNEKLYKRLVKQDHPRICPYRYISCKKQLNTLYDSMDAVLTKPGGITVSECLMKRKPIFIYTHLPGQEKINVDALLEHGLITILPFNDNLVSFEHQLVTILSSEEFSMKLKVNLENYHGSLTKITPMDLIVQDAVNYGVLA